MNDPRTVQDRGFKLGEREVCSFVLTAVRLGRVSGVGVIGRRVLYAVTWQPRSRHGRGASANRPLTHVVRLRLFNSCSSPDSSAMPPSNINITTVQKLSCTQLLVFDAAVQSGFGPAETCNRIDVGMDGCVSRS